MDGGKLSSLLQKRNCARMRKAKAVKRKVKVLKGAFIPHKTARTVALQERIDAIVQEAKKKISTGAERGEDVIFHNRTPLLYRSLHAVKIG